MTQRKFSRGDRVFVEVLSHPAYSGPAHLQGRVTDYLGYTNRDGHRGSGSQHRYTIELDVGGTVDHREGRLELATQTES